MKSYFVLTTFVLLTLSLPGFAQQEKPEQRGSKSIHQLEWERHQNFEPAEKPAPFLGKPGQLQSRAGAPSKEIFGYLPYWVYPNYPNLNYELLTTIAYFGAEMDELGNLTNLHNWPAAGLIDKAHSAGVRVVLTVINFVPTSLSSILGDPNRRTKLINNLLQQVQNANADGVSIDFEAVPSGQRANLTAFMTELAETFHDAIPGSFVTIFTPAVDWSDVFDYFALAEITDGLIMQGYDYHWTTAPTAGPVAPLTGTRWGFYNVLWTINDYLFKTNSNTEKLILSVPFYGLEWPTEDDGLESNTLESADAIFYNEAYTNAMQYGWLWDAESQTPWYKFNDGRWHQGWYDDSLSLGKKFEVVNEQDLKGIAIWALSYDGTRQELQGSLSDAFGSTAAPLRPAAFRVFNVGEGKVEIAGEPAAGATAYKIYTSADAQNFDQGTNFPGAVNVLTDLSDTSTYYFKMAAVNGNGESNQTEVLAVRPSQAPADVLIVNGFDRTIGTVNTFDYIKRFAPSLAKSGYAFDSCSNEAVIAGEVVLTDYETVLWISGEEGTADESFSFAEQALVANFLENGGNLFVSGSEIGYDLVGQGSDADKAFYQTYLKSEYVRDKVDTHSASGAVGGIFQTIAGLTFDDGFHGTYNVDYPDGIKPLAGAVLNLVYAGFDANAYGGAGIQYEGAFGESTVPGKLVYLAFPFETIYPESSRDALMSSVLNYFGGAPTGVQPPIADGTAPEAFELAQNYPNPFNPVTTIRYRLSHASPLPVRLQIYNLLGQRVITLVDENQPAGEYRVQWEARDERGQSVPSGVYVYRLQVGNRTQQKQMTVVR